MSLKVGTCPLFIYLGLDKWLTDAKADLWDRKVTSSAAGILIDVKPKLTKLYSYGQGLSLYSVMALTVDFAVRGWSYA